MHDLVIRGGTVVDGSGGPSREADVGVDGGRITAVGKVGPGKRELDAKGMLVTPGFVDMHTHYDAQATWDPQLTPSSWHGVTTAVMGNCGVGFAPAAKDRHEWLISVMEGVEDIPGSAMAEGITWDWETFPQFLDALERMPRIMDIGTQVPHAAIRGYVMGDRGANNEPANAQDIAAMRKLVVDGLKAGALGFSTSRTSLHKAMDGQVMPGTYATKEELFGIGDALKEVGHGVFQFAPEHTDLPLEFPWMREIAKVTGRPVCVNLSQTDKNPVLWKEVLGLLDSAAKDGLPVFAQCAGRSIGIIMTLEATVNPLMASGPFFEVAFLPWEEKLARLRDPAVRKRIIEEEPLDLGEFPNFVTRSFHKMFSMPEGVEYEPAASESLAARSERTGIPARQIAYDLLMERDGKGLIYFPLFNYSDGNLDVVRNLHSHPRTRMGLSDAGAHCGAICDGGMPTFMLTHWTRDRVRGERLPLELVVHRQTRQTAEFYGLKDRGLVAPGMRADLNVINYPKLGFSRPEVVFDLPAQGRRLVQKARGYVATICAGQVTLEHDTFTGALPGKLIRGPQG